jgi:hypothetical protein
MIYGLDTALDDFRNKIKNLVDNHIDDILDSEEEKLQEKQDHTKELLNRYLTFLESAVLDNKYKLPKKVIQELEDDYNIIKNEINK